MANHFSIPPVQDSTQFGFMCHIKQTHNTLLRYIPVLLSVQLVKQIFKNLVMFTIHFVVTFTSTWLKISPLPLLKQRWELTSSVHYSSNTTHKICKIWGIQRDPFINLPTNCYARNSAFLHVPSSLTGSKLRDHKVYQVPSVVQMTYWAACIHFQFHHHSIIRAR
jgi:hypothetical protein